MSAPTCVRTWEVGDPICEQRDGAWRKGTVVDVDKWCATIRWDGAAHLVYRSPSSRSLVDPEQVPIDERHWLPEKVRDQLVRQEAAGRLREMAEWIPADGSGSLLALDAFADALADCLVPDADLTRAARALLNPAPAPTP